MNIYMNMNGINAPIFNVHLVSFENFVCLCNQNPSQLHLI